MVKNLGGALFVGYILINIETGEFMVASIRNVSLRSVIVSANPPPLFEVNFSLFSNGSLNGKNAQQFTAAYANSEFGTWPASAPLYSGDPWPTWWFGPAIPDFTSSWYISGGKLYENGTSNYPGALFPIYIPFSLLSNTIRFTVKFVAVTPKPGSFPENSILPYIIPMPTASGDQKTAEIFIDNDTSPYNILNNTTSDFDYGVNPSNFQIPEVWDGLEHTMVWEINSVGQNLLTYDGVPYGLQNPPWQIGNVPTSETYFGLGTTLIGDTINSFGYTYAKIESL